MGTGGSSLSSSGTWQTHIQWVSDSILMSCQESTGVRGPQSKPSLGNLFSRNTANLVHSSKSFYCLYSWAHREGPRNAEIAHQAQLIPKLVFLFNEPGLTFSKIPTIIAILGCQLRGHFSIQDLLRYCARLPRGTGRGLGLLHKGI